MKYEVNPIGLNRLERDIAPPMNGAITIPVKVDGKQAIIYVCRSPFFTQPGNVISDRDLKALAVNIASRLTEPKPAAEPEDTEPER
jgi:hypothetical protein